MFTTDEDWSPSINLGHNKISVDSTTQKQAEERARRAIARAVRCEEKQSAKQVLTEAPSEVPHKATKMCNKATQTDHTGDIPVDFFNEEQFLNDDGKVLYYTGLPNGELLQNMFQLVVPYPGQRREYYWQSLIVTLMKLRLNFGHQDLAYRVGVSMSTICRRFQDMLDLMYTRLDFLISWPDREQLRKTMPLCFRPTYGLKVAAIIDCYEIKVEKPSNLLAKASTWSQYKQANTVKVLIAIAPQGVTTFVSDSWGGRVSDKHLTRESGLLKNLLPGDIILADRGFDVAEEVGLAQASLCIPAFTKGVSQLSPTEIEKTRKLANVRIHVERVIGATRQRYSILMATLPIQYLKKSSGDIPTVDKIVRVCSALNNLCVSVVPFE